MLFDRVPTSAPIPLQWSVEMFVEADVFGLFEGKRGMLIDGVIYQEGPEPPPHSCARSLTADALREAVKSVGFVLQRANLHLAKDTDPKPDVAVIRGTLRDHKEMPTTAMLVAEVADLSLRFDQDVKAGLYAGAGIPEYWIVDLTERRLLVLRDPFTDSSATHGHAYRTCLVLGPTDSVSPLCASSALVKVADLLP